MKKLTVDLENHYKDKLLSIADGSFDGRYRRRFMEREKDSSTGFKLPDANEHSKYIFAVEQFDNDVFKVRSASKPNER